MKESLIIHCIGDSHVSFFSGLNKIQPLWPSSSSNFIPIFKTYRLGPALAYNLMKYQTRYKAREAISVLLERDIMQNKERCIAPHSMVLFCFGEIDNRAHIIRQSMRQGCPVSEVAEECAERYFDFLLTIKALDYKVIVWNAIPSSRHEKIPNPDYPIFGTCKERNYATRVFNNKIKALCREAEIPFIDVFDQLVDEDGLTKMEYYFDPIHLSQRAMPLVLREMNNTLGSAIVPLKWLDVSFLKWQKRLMTFRNKFQSVFCLISNLQ